MTAEDTKDATAGEKPLPVDYQDPNAPKSTPGATDSMLMSKDVK